MDDDDPNVVVEPGPSLAKGPAMITGAILVAFGLTGLLTNAHFPHASSAFPNGTAQGSSWLGFEVNGWTNFFAITAGALLLFGAAQHHLAKTMSLIVGLALAACAVIAIIDGEDVLGLAAANFWTKLGFAVAGGAMLLNALMPRTMRRRYVGDRVATAPAAGAGAAAGAGMTRRRAVADDDGLYDDGVAPARTGTGTGMGTAAATGAAAGAGTGMMAANRTQGTHRRGRFFRRNRDRNMAYARDDRAMGADDATMAGEDRTIVDDGRDLPPRA